MNGDSGADDFQSPFLLSDFSPLVLGFRETLRVLPQRLIVWYFDNPLRRKAHSERDSANRIRSQLKMIPTWDTEYFERITEVEYYS